MIPSIPNILWYHKFDPLITNNNYRHIGFHGGRGGLKTTHFSYAALELARRKKMRIFFGREIQKSIKNSVHQALSDKITQQDMTDYRVTDHSIINTNTGSNFMFEGLLRNLDNIKGLEDVDIAWIEEAQSVSMESLTKLIPSIRKKGSKIWYSFNRNAENDPVWEKVFEYADINPRVFVCKLNIMDIPKIFQNQELMEEMEWDKKRNYREYLHIWEGEPVGQAAEAIIDIEDVSRAMERNIINPVGGLVMGADVARMGDDRTVFYMRKGLKTIKQHEHIKKKINETVDIAVDFLDNNYDCIVNVDSTGMPGVGDYIEKAKYTKTQHINFGLEGSDHVKEPDKYVNVITEMWFNFKDLLENEEIDIPNDPELKTELTKRRFYYTKDQRKIVEPKRDYKKRENRSPDKADAILLCYYQSKYMLDSDKVITIHHRYQNATKDPDW